MKANLQARATATIEEGKMLEVMYVEECECEELWILYTNIAM